MKAAVKEQQSMFVSPVSKASSSKDEQYITPTKIGPDEAETVSAMNSLIRKKSVLNGIIWQYINETTGVIELSIHEKSLFGKSKQLSFWIGPSRADCGLYGTFLDILVEAHFFDFPESRLQGTFLRLQKPRLIPNLVSVSEASFSMTPQTHDRTLLLRMLRVEEVGSFGYSKRCENLTLSQAGVDHILSMCNFTEC